jgi:hypothetical protein
MRRLGFLAVLVVVVSAGCGGDDKPPAPAPTGSCCVDGACTVTTQTSCAGTWAAAGDCEPNPCPGGPFELRIKLADAAGNPKPGIQIQAFNRVPCWTLPDVVDCVNEDARRSVETGPRGGSVTGLPPADRLYGSYPNPFTSQTTIRFSLASASPIALRVYDGARRPIRAVLSGRQQAGEHTATWDGRDSGGRGPAGGSGIYEISLAVWSPDSTRIVYQDTVFAAWYDPPGLSLGVTDEQGVFASTDQALFPGASDQPPLEAVDESGVARGSFAFDDTLVIAAADTLAGVTREYKRILSNSGNRFDLIWD